MSDICRMSSAQRVSLGSLKVIAKGTGARVGEPRPSHTGDGYATIFVEMTWGPSGEHVDHLFLIEPGGCVAKVYRNADDFALAEAPSRGLSGGPADH